MSQQINAKTPLLAISNTPTVGYVTTAANMPMLPEWRIVFDAACPPSQMYMLNGNYYLTPSPSVDVES